MGQLKRPTIHPLPRLARRAARLVLRQLHLMNWFHRFRLTGPHPIRLLAVPVDPRPGDPVRGTRLMTGRFVEAGQILTRTGVAGIAAESWNAADLWSARTVTAGWRDWLHGFGWLRDLDAVSDRTAAKRQAERLVRGWLDANDRWQSPAWEPAVLSRRIMAWMAHAPLILSNKDHIYRSRVLNSLARQARHLARRVEDAEAGPSRTSAIIGLCYAGLFLPQGGARLRWAVQLLERELNTVVLADGGVVTRSPSDALTLFEDLKGLMRAFERSRDQVVPGGVLRALDRLAPGLRALTHGDGYPALFNGSFADRDRTVDDILGDDYSGMDPLDNGRHSGFQRLARGESVVIVDAGPPSPLAYSRNNHAGTLGF
ncbi:MAG: heparinase II/III family protein, partial [Sphingomonadales bacterium]